MARFDVVHSWVKIPDSLKEGELFRFTLQEPTFTPLIDENGVAYMVIITVRIENGRLVPNTDHDKRMIDDWKRRHKDTSEYAF